MVVVIVIMVVSSTFCVSVTEGFPKSHIFLLLPFAPSVLLGIASRVQRLSGPAHLAKTVDGVMESGPLSRSIGPRDAGAEHVSTCIARGL